MKPMLMNTEMVKAILAGRKTQTRRLVKERHLRVLDSPYHKEHSEVPDKVLLEKLCELPYQSGDVLYVRESWCKGSLNGGAEQYFYKADDNDFHCHWKPPIHMPKEAARIFLRVTNVRVERLQDVTVEGILEEGIDTKLPLICESSINGNIPNDNQRALMDKMSKKEREEYIQDLARHTYMGWCYYADKLFRVYEQLWNSTIKKSDLGKYGWDANPWVWVIEFERISKEEALKNV